MPARVFVVTSESAGEGKTHVAAGLARWLRSRGHHVVPLHLSSRAGDVLPCPGSGSVSRAAAILAEACGLAPSTDFESDWNQLASLGNGQDDIVIEAAGDFVPQAGWTILPVRRRSDSIQIADR